MAIRPYQGTTPTIAASAYVDEQAAVIGDVTIGEDSSVWPMCSIRGDVNAVRIGARTSIQDGSVIHVTHRHAARPEGHATVIGDEVTVGHKVILHGCTIEHRCLIGMGSLILDGAVIRSQVLLGAGSLVTEGKELEGGYLWLGQPARRVRPLTEQELQWFAYSAQHYVKLKHDYRR
jgi:carbonic anhydrase/acetyltransferase-like protein (isoleucine patch superfamily)